MTYNGVKSFRDTDEWCATVQIQGVRAIIYTADNAKECASAYDHYVRLTNLAGKGTVRLNNVGMGHDFERLLNTLVLVGGPVVREAASKQLTRIKDLQANKEA